MKISDFIKENKRFVVIILIIFVLLFIWYEVRPSYIRKSCANEALIKGSYYSSERYKAVYEGCLHEKGL